MQRGRECVSIMDLQLQWKYFLTPCLHIDDCCFCSHEACIIYTHYQHTDKPEEREKYRKNNNDVDPKRNPLKAH
ncbi:hypothetical protein QTP88_025679 [Uroleucon formosanum]